MVQERRKKGGVSKTIPLISQRKRPDVISPSGGGEEKKATKGSPAKGVSAAV